MRNQEDQDECMTDLDKLGMRLAAQAHFEAIEARFLNRRERRSMGKITALESLEDLLKRDAEREKDGFPKKIKFRRILTGSGKVGTVPFVEEDQLAHGEFEPKRIVQLGQFLDDDEDDNDDIGEGVGHGKGEVGDVIGEVPLPLGGGGGDGDDGGDGDQGPGAGEESADHAFEEEAYEIGRRLMEKLQLPNLKEKRKKVPIDEYTYDLDDRHRGSGQFLDKKATLRRVVKTNLILGRVDKDNLDTTKMVIGPQDLIYRVLSRERVWKSRAVVIFMRDYSGSMWGEPTEALVSQHLMIYAWLLFVYERLVIPRFIVHDTRAREVTAREYFGLASSGGTMIVSGYKEINKIVKGGGLDNDYNIYVFQGTDGDDFDDDGRETLPELEQILEYANRVGVTLFKHPYYTGKNIETSFEKYIKKGGILERKDVFRMHVMSNYNITEEQNIEALKVLIAQD